MIESGDGMATDDDVTMACDAVLEIQMAQFLLVQDLH
ncbi:unnamed protein product [uncultured virus]|nr:unnamed protein product [uncultured virus]